MIIKAKIKQHNEWLFWEELPEISSINTILSEKHIAINKSPINISTYQILSRGLFILCADMRVSAPVDIISEIEGEAIVSQFILSKSESAHGFTFSKHNIRYIPSLYEEHPIESIQDFLYFMVIMTPELYQNMISIHTPLHLEFKEKMKEKKVISIVEEDLFVTTEMKGIIDSIRTTTNKNELKQIFVNARVLELIMLQFEQFSFISDKLTDLLKIEDVQKLEEAQRILRNSFVNPPTHKQLSKLVLLNEFKLRNGFKQHFGTTIYNYITRIRMEEAKRLILNENKNMYEVSTIVGFKHQASFTHAFKKYYGLLPSEISR
jgi:AraC-like DNA-binding protein